MKVKKSLSLFFAFLLSCAMGKAQNLYTYVQQNGENVEALGTAVFSIGEGSDTYSVAFDGGEAVMTAANGARVTALPMKDHGRLVVAASHDGAPSGDTPGTLSRKVTETAPFATVYSPFRLQVPDNGGCEVYAPEYDEEAHVLRLNAASRVAPGAVIPACTGLVVKSDVTFTITALQATDTHKSSLSGTAVAIANPTKDGEVGGCTVYTLGHRKGSTDFGFFRYTGTTLGGGKAYMLAPTVPGAAAGAKAISFAFDETTAIGGVEESPRAAAAVRKLAVGGQVVIVRGDCKYNVNGQKLK